MQICSGWSHITALHISTGDNKELLSPASRSVTSPTVQLTRWLINYSNVIVSIAYLDVLLPVELGRSLFWQTTGAVLQWGEDSGGNVDVVALNRHKQFKYFGLLLFMLLVTSKWHYTTSQISAEWVLLMLLHLEFSACVEASSQQLASLDGHRRQLPLALQNVPNGVDVGYAGLLFIVHWDLSIPEGWHTEGQFLPHLNITVFGF